MKSSIFITTKNRKKDLVYTLDKLSETVQKKDVNCFIFDDGSDDGSFNEIKEKFPNIEIQRNEISKGYIYCRNRMLNEADADFAISLDDDAHFISNNSIEIIENHFVNNPKCGLIAFRIFWNLEEPKKIDTQDKINQVKSFVGCGHAWRMSAWRDIPNYPEWFQFYGEESFASLQLFKKKWEVHYVPEILIQHRVDLKQRAKQKSEFSYRYRRSLRAGWYNIFLFYPIFKIPYFFCYSMLMQLKKVFKGNFKILKPLFLASIDLIKNFKTIKKNRNPLSEQEFADYRRLKEPKIYWNPEK